MNGHRYLYALGVFIVCCQTQSPFISHKDDLVKGPFSQAPSKIDEILERKKANLTLSKESTVSIDLSIPKELREKLSGVEANKNLATISGCGPMSENCIPEFPVVNRSYHFDGSYHYTAGEDRYRNNFVFINNKDGDLVCYHHIKNPFELKPKFRLGSGAYGHGRMYQAVSSVKAWKNRFYGKFTVFSFAVNDACNLSKDGTNCKCQLHWLQDDIEDVDFDVLEEKGEEVFTAKSPKLEKTNDLLTLPIVMQMPRDVKLKSFDRDYKNKWLADRLLVFNLVGGAPWVCDLSLKDCKPYEIPRQESLLLPQQCASTASWIVCTPYPGTPPLSSYRKQENLFVFSRNLKDFTYFRKPQLLIPHSQLVKGAVGLAIHDDKFYLTSLTNKRSSYKPCGDLACTDEAGKMDIRIFKLTADSKRTSSKSSD